MLVVQEGANPDVAVGDRTVFLPRVMNRRHQAVFVLVEAEDDIVADAFDVGECFTDFAGTTPALVFGDRSPGCDGFGRIPKPVCSFLQEFCRENVHENQPPVVWRIVRKVLSVQITEGMWTEQVRFWIENAAKLH